MQKSLAGSKLILASYSMRHLGNSSILAYSNASSCGQSDNSQPGKDTHLQPRNLR